MYAKIDHAPVYADLKKFKCSWSCRRKKGIVCNVRKILRLISQSDIITVMSDFFCWWMMKSNMSGSVCFRILEMRMGTRNIVCNNESKNNLFEKFVP